MLVSAGQRRAVPACQDSPALPLGAGERPEPTGHALQAHCRGFQAARGRRQPRTQPRGAAMVSRAGSTVLVLPGATGGGQELGTDMRVAVTRGHSVASGTPSSPLTTSALRSPMSRECSGTRGCPSRPCLPQWLAQVGQDVQLVHFLSPATRHTRPPSLPATSSGPVPGQAPSLRGPFSGVGLTSQMNVTPLQTPAPRGSAGWPSRRVSWGSWQHRTHGPLLQGGR